MSKNLAVLERIKRRARKNARLGYAAEERRRAALEDEVEAIRTALAASREHGMADDALWLAESHAWRLRLELRRRQGDAALIRQTHATEARRQHLVEADREARLSEVLLESALEQERRQAARAERKELDEAAINRWRSPCD